MARRGDQRWGADLNDAGTYLEVRAKGCKADGPAAVGGSISSPPRRVYPSRSSSTAAFSAGRTF